MYEDPLDNPCNPAALIVTVVALVDTVLVYVDPFNVIVTTCPSSAPDVVTVTVPSELSSVAFSTAPQDNAPVPTALILGAAVSTLKLDDVT